VAGVPIAKSCRAEAVSEINLKDVWDKIRSNCSVLHVPKPLATIQRYLRLSPNILHIHDSFPGCFRVINIDIIY